MRRSPVGLTALLVLAAACDDRGDPAGVERPEAHDGVHPALTAIPTGSGAGVLGVGDGYPVFRAPLPGGTVVYDAIPSPLSGLDMAVGFERTLTDEWGDLVRLSEAGILGQVTVGLSSFACGNDDTRAATEACVSIPGTTFSHPVTVSLYEVDRSGADPAVGDLIATRTTVFELPFRPSWDEVNCSLPPVLNAPFGGRWYDEELGACVNGLAVEVVFDFVGDGVELPEELIFGVAFDTETSGESPLGVPGPYNALMVGAAGTSGTPPPSVGTNVEGDYTFLDSELDFYYCDGGAAGLDTFRRDGCWTTTTPMVRIELGGATDDQGPVASEVEAVASIEVGGTLGVTALVDDSESGGSTLAGAEMQLVPAGDAPADDGWTEAAASDGAFDSPTEAVEAELTAPDGAALLELCVRGADEAGNVGEPTCVSLAVVDPDGGSVTGGGWWNAVDDEGEPLGRATVAFQAGYHPKTGGPMANLQLQLPGLRLHVRDFDWLVVTDDSAALSGRVTRGDEEIDVLLRVGDGTGPDGEDTVELLVRSTREEGETLFDSNGPQPLAGGSIQIHD